MLVKIFPNQNEDHDERATIEYSQRVSTDRTRMLQCSSAVNDFNNDMREKTKQYIPLSYMAKSKFPFLNNIKESQTNKTVIVL